MIYKECLGFHGVDTFFESTYRMLCKHARARNARNRPAAYAQTPYRESPKLSTSIIFLINRQIFHEASATLRNSSITFSHGLLNVKLAEAVIAPAVIRKLRSITINDSAHKILQNEIIPDSWYGYNRLLQQLSEILKSGHALKSLTIHFRDVKLAEHMESCVFRNDITCAYADDMLETFRSLQQIRRVGKATITGLIPHMAKELKNRLESTPLTFFDLTPEIRQKIYSYAADWSDASRACAKAFESCVGPPQAQCNPRRSTPRVLLLNRQITAEALNVLREKPLQLHLPNDWRFTGTAAAAYATETLTAYITPATLSHISKVSATIEYWGNLGPLDASFLAPFATAAGGSVRILELKFVDRYPLRKFNVDYVNTSLLSKIQIPDALLDLHGLEEVSISGDLPLVIADQIGRILVSDHDATRGSSSLSCHADGADTPMRASPHAVGGHRHWRSPSISSE